ncbi:MAG: GNAT family N-acetyltransferase [Dehalococcoidia bacterium]
MTEPSGDLVVREAEPEDAPEIRSLVTRALLSAGLSPPEPTLDADLVDLGYYRVPGRGLWVAERAAVVVGCAAMDRGEAGAAVLRRLSGGGLDALVSTALDFAAAQGVAVVETVLPPGLPGTRDALQRAGFESPPGASSLLLRRTV